MPPRKPSARDSKPWVGVIMGSSSDLKYMQAAIDVLRELEVPHEWLALHTAGHNRFRTEVEATLARLRAGGRSPGHSSLR